MTPDPAGMAAADPANPQSWNRYAYVMNYPLAMVDPLGLCEVTSATVLGVTTTTYYWGGSPCIIGPPEGCWFISMYGGTVGGVGCAAQPYIPTESTSGGSVAPVTNVGTIRSLSRMQCAAIQANDLSLPSIAGISDDTILGKGAHLFGDNVFSDAVDFYESAKNLDVMSMATQVAESGTHLGLVPGGTKGVIDIAQDHILHYAFQNLTKAAAKELIDDIAAAKYLYDFGTFAYGFTQCR